MLANFYIMGESFEYNNNYSNDEIEKKIECLSKDIRKINKYKETNKLFVNFTDIYNRPFYSTFTIGDFICKPKEVKQSINRDIVNFVFNIFEKASNTDNTSQEIITDLLPKHDQNICHGLIAFHKIPEISQEFQVIYGIDGWYKFRRYFLGKYPKDSVFFIDECKKYFPKLYFHENNYASVERYLSDYSCSIVKHLTALDDKFQTIDKTNLNRSQVLVHFSSIASLDENATLEGRPDRKEDFTFYFENDKQEKEAICCEPHMKLCFKDNDIKKQIYLTDCRIYFHEGNDNIQKGNILIGHIGKHL